MVGMHDAATMMIRCENQIEDLTLQIEKFNAMTFNKGVVRIGIAVYGRVSGEDGASVEAIAQCIQVSIANACHLMRAVKGFAPEIKQAVSDILLCVINAFMLYLSSWLKLT
jgi:hypothetical protein